jgi:hypothetical protein
MAGSKPEILLIFLQECVPVPITEKFHPLYFMVFLPGILGLYGTGALFT